MADLPQVSPDLLKLYQGEIARLHSPKTVLRKMSSLRRFFSWAAGKGIIAENPLVRGVEESALQRVRKPESQQTSKPVSRSTDLPTPRIHPFPSSGIPFLKSAIFAVTGLAAVTLAFFAGQKLAPSFQIRPQEAQITQKTETPTTRPPSQSEDVAGGPKTEIQVLDVLKGKILELLGENPVIKALEGPLKIESEGITLQATPLSDGDITLAPDGQGQLLIRSSTTTENAIDIRNANLTTGTLFYANVGNTGSKYKFLQFTSGPPAGGEILRFSVDAKGNVFSSGKITADESQVNELQVTKEIDLQGDLLIGGVIRLNKMGRLASITGYYQDSGIFLIDQGTDDVARITKKGITATTPVLELILDETGKTSSGYDTLVLQRKGGKPEGYALNVKTGSALFSGDIVVQGNIRGSGALNVSGNQSVTGDQTVTGDLAVNGGDLTSTATTFNLLNSTVTTLNVGGAATTVSIGASTGTTTINNALTVTGTTTLNGAFTLGDGGDTGAINTSDWDIDSSGNASGIGTIGMDGDLTISQATPSIFLTDTTTGEDDYSVNIDGSSFTLRNETDSRNDITISGTGAVTINGASVGEGTSVLTLTSGDLVLTDGDLTLSSGEISATTDDTAGTAFSFTGNTITTGTAFGISATGLTTGEALDITSTSSPTAGGTQSAVDLNFTNAATTTANTFRGVDISTGDATALGNTTYGLYLSGASTGNAAKTIVGGYSTVTSSSTTADTLIALDLATTHTGAISAGTKSIYGLRSQPNSSGATDTGGTINTYGGYFDATGAAGGTSSAYGVYIADISGADTNVGLCFDCDGTWTASTVASGIQFGTDTNAVNLYRSASDTLRTDDSLYVATNTTLGDAASDTVTFNAVVASNILADASNTRDLGSSSVRWANGYFTTIDATNLTGTVTGGSTTAATWTINSDNSTNNAEISGLAFETGSATFNAVMQWNASGDAGRYTGYDNNLVSNYPISVFSQVSGGNQTFTSGSLFNYGQDSTHAITQGGAFVGVDIDFSSNITNTTQNQTGVLITLKDGSTSGTAIGFQTAGTFDYGLDIGGTPGTADIRLSNAETISNTTNGTIAFAFDGTNELSLTTTALFPSTDSGLDLGSSTNQFADLYLDGGNINLDNATDIDIDDNTASAFTISESTNNYFLITTTDTGTVVTLDLPVAGSSTTTGNLFTANTTKTINLGTGTSADTINIGTGGTTADAITIGNTGVATTIDVNSGAATVNAIDILADSVSSANALELSADALTTGTALAISSTATAFNGELLTLSKTGASGSTAFTSDIANITYSQTFNAAPGDSTGNVLDISRSITVDDSTAGAITGTVSGALVRLADTCTAGTADTCTSTADVLSITQSYASNSGSALNVTTAGTGFALRVNDDGTLTDSTPLVVDASGNVGIGITAPAATLDVLTAAASTGFNLAGTAPASVAGNGTSAATNTLLVVGTAGGASSGVTGQTGGTGGALSLTSGVGGAVAGASGIGGIGGGLTLAGGAGGAGAATGGAGGAISITAGAAGTGGNANGGTLTLNSGAVTGSGTSTLNLGTSNSTVINIGDSTVTKTIDIGGVTSSDASTINIATEGTAADVIAIGNTNASTTLALTGGDDWSMAATGVLTMSASADQTTAIVVTDTNYTNSLSIGDNTITGTTANIDLTYFDVTGATGAVTIDPQTTGTYLDFTLETAWTSGTLINADFASATTQGAATMTGMSLNLNTNLTTPAAGQNVTGIDVQTPVASTTSNTTTYTGYNLSAAGAITNATAGSFAWRGVNIALPNITQSAGGSVTSSGILLTTGSITTAGTQHGLNVAATGVGAGTLNAINIGTITGSGGTETAINIAAGWDTDINATTSLEVGIGGTNEVVLNATDFSPATSDGSALGTGSLMWGDLFLASGAVINFNNGDVTLTHASNLLTFAGGNLDMNTNLILNIGDAGTDFTAGGGLTLAGTLTANGDVTLGNASTDLLTVTAQVIGDITFRAENPAGTTENHIISVANAVTSTTAGGNLTLRSGAGFGVGSSAGVGGTLALTAGAGSGTSAGGPVTITAGAGGTTSGNTLGGAITITSGAGGAPAGTGGAITITTGAGGAGGAAGTLYLGIGGTNELTLTATALAPSTDSGQDLGTSTSQFADLFLDGGNINLDNATDIDIDDNTASALTISEGANNYLLITTTDTGTVVTLDLPVAGSSTTTGNLFTANTTKTINLGTGTSADTINIGTGGTTADAITIGNTGVATTIDVNSGAATVNAIDILADSVSSANALELSADALTTGTALALSSTATAFNGELLTLSKTGASGSTAFTSDIVNVTYSQTFNGGVGLTSSGNVLDISRAITLDNATNTHTISGALVTISDTMTQTAGTLSHSGDVLALTQNYGTTTGAILSLTPPGTTNAGGTLEAINIGSITASNGTDLALTFGTGWDTDINATTSLEVGIGGTNELTLTATALAPSTDSGQDLGTSTSQFADLFLDGGNINLDNATDIDIDDNTASAFTISESTNNYFLITTTDTATVVTLDLPVAGSSTTTGNLFTANTTKTINLGTGTSADTINIGTGGTTADVITVGNTGVATTIDVNSGAATVNAIDILADSVSSANALELSADALTTGTALALSSTATAFNGELLTLSKTGASGSTAFTSDIVNVTYSQTFNGGVGLTSSGNVLDISRAITLDNATNTHTISGALVTISDTMTQTAGTLSHSGDVLALTQNYGTTTGAILSLTPPGTTNAGGTLEAINIGSITTSNGTDLALTFGTGWDTDINATTSLEIGIGGTNEVVLNATDLSPATSDGSALGTGSLMWSDLFLASGGVINFNNGDVTVTHSSNLLTIGGDGDLAFGATNGVGTRTISVADSTSATTAGGNLTLRAGAGAGTGSAAGVGGTASLIAGAGSGTSPGGPAVITGGAGGTTSGSQAGGAVTITSGAGGAPAGVGGAITITSGVGSGGTASGTVTITSGGTGATTAPALVTVTSGAGAALGGGNPGGAAGATTISSGTGGATTSGGTTVGGAAGTLSITGGTGGASSSGSGVGGAGAVVTISGGAGGAGAATGGVGGNITITGGNAGTGGNVNGGTLTLNSGAVTGTGTSTIDLGSANVTTLNLGTANTIKTINLGTGTSADTINIGTGGTTADAITIGNTGVATTIDVNSGAATVNAIDILADSVTTANALELSADALTTGTALALSSTATAFNGELLTLSKTGASGSTAFTSDIANITYSQTFNAAPGDSTGNVLDISRAITVDDGTAGAITGTVSGALVRLADNCTAGTADTCTSTADVLSITQSYASNSGSALNVTTAGTGFALRVNDDGTLTDSTPTVIDSAGRVVIGATTGARGKVDIYGTSGTANAVALRLGNTASGTHQFISFSDGVNYNYGFGTDGTNNVGDFTWRSGLYDDSFGTERMRLTQGGNVGIGTTAPGSLLHIATSTTAVGLNIYEQASADADSYDLNFRKARGTVASPTVITTADELGTIAFRGYSGAGGYVTGAAIKAISEGTIATTRIPAHLSFWTGTDAAPTVLTERVRIDKGGNVGIGTTAPGSALDVKGTLRLSGSTSGYVGLAPAAAAGSTTYTLPSADGTSGYVLSTNGTGTLSWAAGGAVASGWTDDGTVVRLTTSSDNVGIGTTSPASKLDVTTTALGTTQTDTSGLALVNTTAAASDLQQISPALRWRGFGWKTDVTAASQSVDFRAFVRPIQGAAAPTGGLDFQSSVNGAAYTDLVTITSGGNVGIGTTSPSQLLHLSASSADTAIRLQTGNITSGASQTFSSTGAEQTWVVPNGVTSIDVDVKGGAGGDASATGGAGGRVQATMSVTPGETLYIYVGAVGGNGGGGTGPGGFNGGGNGGTVDGALDGAGGGGASDIRQGGNALGNRQVVGGGGGGAAVGNGGGTPGAAGAGGGTTGASGANGSGPSGTGGGGGTQSAGGSAGSTGGSAGSSGTGGNGGGQSPGTSGCGAGGGGGGYYGGGGGGSSVGGTCGAGGAGGGSSFAASGVTGVTHTQGSQTGSGQIIVTYDTVNWTLGGDNSNSGNFKVSFATAVGSSDYITITPGGNVGIGTTAPAYKLDIATSTASDRGINIAHTATTGTNYGVYSSVTGAATANVGGYFVATGATTSRGLEVAALTSATSTGLTIGALSGTTANTGINIGAISGASATGTGITVGNISTTGTTNYGIQLGTMTGGTTSNYQISTGVLTSATTTTNAQINLGGVVTTGGTTNYGINVGALSGTGTTNYGINVTTLTSTGTTNYGMNIGGATGAATTNYGLLIGAVSGATTNYGLYTTSGTTVLNATSGNVGIGTTAPLRKLHVGAGADTPVISADGITVQIAGTANVGVRDATNNIEQAMWVGDEGGGVYTGRLGTATLHNLNITTNNATRVTIASGGNVGIGDTTPDALLDVDSSSNTVTAFGITNNTATTIGASAAGGINVLASTSLTTGDLLELQLTESALTTGAYVRAWDVTAGASVFSVGEDGVVTIAGGGDGTDSLTLTTGDILISDGDFDLSGGDFNVTLDSGDTANFTGTQPASVGTTPGTAANAIIGISAATGGNTTITTTGTGGVGGGISWTLGTGGTAASANTASTGGAGGAYSLTGGIGGAAAATGTNVGGAGGNLELTGGTGGAATLGTSNTGGVGGDIFIVGGAVGTGGSPAVGDVLLAITSGGTSRGNVGIGTTAPGAKLDIRGGINAGTNGTEFAVNTSGLITTSSVGTAALRTATSSISGSVATNLAMNDYTFFPNIEHDDCSAGAADVLRNNGQNLTNNTDGSFQIGLSCGTGTWDVRWRYVTASDRPTIWLVVNSDGTISSIWESEDPMSQFEYPENPNPLAGTSLEQGQRFATVEPLTVAQFEEFYSSLPQTDQEQILAKLREYVVEKRGWLDKLETVSDLAKITPRYEPSGRQWAMRFAAEHYSIAPSELIRELLLVVGDKLELKSNVFQVLTTHLDQRVQTIAARAAEEEAIKLLPQNQRNTDIAEWYSIQERETLEAGDVVAIGPDGPIGKSINSYDRSLLGIISTAPSQILGRKTVESDVKVALAGRVPVKISTENGPVFAGDPLTSSSTPGVAMKATRAGQIVGKALESFDDSMSNVKCQMSNGQEVSCGKILTFVNVSWYDPDVYLTSTGDLSIVQISTNPTNNTNDPLAAQLEATGSATATDSGQVNELTSYQVIKLLSDGAQEVIERIGVFSETVTATLKAGIIEVNQLIGDQLTGRTVNVTEKLISPVVETDLLTANRLQITEISSATESANLVINLEAVDSSQSAVSRFGQLLVKGNLEVTQDATISGTLYADRIKAREIEGLSATFGELSASVAATQKLAFEEAQATNQSVIERIRARIDDLATRLPGYSASQSPNSSIAELLNSTATPSATLAFSAATSWQTETEQQTESVNLPSGLNLLGNFNVYGQTQVADISINGQAAIVGTNPSDPTLTLSLTLSPNSITAFGDRLRLAGSEGVDIMNGALIVDAAGDVQVRGNLNVGGTLRASRFAPVEGGDLTLDLSTDYSLPTTAVDGSPSAVSRFGRLLVKGAQGEVVASIDASGSARFRELTTPRVIIAAPQEATPSAIYADEITTNATAGRATLSAGYPELKINNPNVTDNTLVYVTPITSTSNQVLYVKSKDSCQLSVVSCQPAFTVAVDFPVWTDIEFNWWIIELAP